MKRSEAWELLRCAAIEVLGNHCAKCGERCGDIPGLLHVDHVRPVCDYPELALDPDNVQILCADCNRIKGTTYRDYRNHNDTIATMLRCRYVQLLSDTIEQQKLMLLMLENLKNLETKRNG